MKCPKCTLQLPDDSEFCQYCGTRIERPIIPPVVEKVTESTEEKVGATAVAEDLEHSAIQLPDFEKMSSDEALKAILQIQAKNALEAMQANSKAQPNNEGDVDFGLVPEKPIFTLAVESVEGEKAYLDVLYTINGEKITYKRRGSTSSNGINGMVDIYETYLPSGQPYKTIYINMYGAKRSKQAPAGFTLGNPAVCPVPAPVPQKEEPVATPVPQTAKLVKTKYCSKCGSAIDHTTKKCSGCGKQYFRVKTLISGLLLLLLIGLAGLNVFQYINHLDNKVVETPQNGEIIYQKTITSTSATGLLKVKSSGANDYFVKLRDHSTSEEVLSFYIHGGSSFEVEVPAGNYDITYACGDTWHGPDALFGDDTACYKKALVFPFSESYEYATGWTVNVWTLTLYPVANDKLYIVSIDVSDF